MDVPVALIVMGLLIFFKRYPVYFFMPFQASSVRIQVTRVRDSMIRDTLSYPLNTKRMISKKQALPKEAVPVSVHYVRRNALSLFGMPASSVMYRSTFMCRSYFSRRLMMVFIIGD